MLRLSYHITRLLLENDCVTLPGFGGLIVSDSSAEYIDEERLFIPPKKIVGFNEKLKMNDWLLAQSYMEVERVDQSAAMRLVIEDLAKFRQELSKKGRALLKDVGIFKIGSDNLTHFVPCKGGLPSPEFYGLTPLQISKVSNLPHKNKIALTDNKPSRDMVRFTVSAVAGLLLIFALSTPTARFPESGKAFLGLTDVERIFVPAPLNSNMTGQKDNDAIATDSILNDGAVDIDARDLRYHIIIASLPNHSGAVQTIKEFEAEGIHGTSIMNCGGRYRIALMSFSSLEEAKKQLEIVRDNSLLTNAWILNYI